MSNVATNTKHPCVNGSDYGVLEIDGSLQEDEGKILKTKFRGKNTTTFKEISLLFWTLYEGSFSCLLLLVYILATKSHMFYFD
jgi:hypothetical protein